MEVLIAEEVNELLKHLESFKENPVDVRNEFNIAILNALWTLLTSERLGYQDPKIRRYIVNQRVLVDPLKSNGTSNLCVYMPISQIAEALG